MKFTILGAKGFVGRYLSNHLKNKGHEVYAPDRNDAEIYKKELGHVMYCIGLTADFRTRPFDTVRAHISVLTDVLEHASFESLTYLSSTRVYGRSAMSTEKSSLLVNVQAPSDLYNLTKLTGESLCLACGIPHVKVARLSNVIGYDPDSDNFMFSLIREAISGKIVLRSNPSSSKDYILLNDVANLLPRIAVAGREHIYNLASGINLRHGQIIHELNKLTGCEIEVIADAPLFEFPVINIDKIRVEFNFVPGSVIDNLGELVSKCRNNSQCK
jgi:nucleoside-diphosphate-sugar epimerase